MKNIVEQIKVFFTMQRSFKLHKSVYHRVTTKVLKIAMAEGETRIFFFSFVLPSNQCLGYFLLRFIDRTSYAMASEKYNRSVFSLMTCYVCGFNWLAYSITYFCAETSLRIFSLWVFSSQLISSRFKPRMMVSHNSRRWSSAAKWPYEYLMDTTGKILSINCHQSSKVSLFPVRTFSVQAFQLI